MSASAWGRKCERGGSRASAWRRSPSGSGRRSILTMARGSTARGGIETSVYGCGRASRWSSVATRGNGGEPAPRSSPSGRRCVVGDLWSHPSARPWGAEPHTDTWTGAPAAGRVSPRGHHAAAGRRAGGERPPGRRGTRPSPAPLRAGARAGGQWGAPRGWGGEGQTGALGAVPQNSPPPGAGGDAPAGLPREYALVDRGLAMLRVDQGDPEGGVYRPAGAFSIFAMHGTGNAPSNDLLDPDIQGIVERRLERHIDGDLNRVSSGFVPRAVYLFANGAEGDVSPAWPPQSRCNVPTLSPLHALDGPFTRTLWEWRAPTATHLASCRHAAREAITVIGKSVGDSAVALFDALGAALTDRLELGRALATLALRDSARSLGICPEPAIGLSTLVGADDAHTRIQGWLLFGLFDVGLKQGSPNPDVPGCQAHKRRLFDAAFGGLPNHLFISGNLPSYAQVTVLRLGNRLIGAVPGEVTTTAGRRMREQMLASARAAGLSVSGALILGHANGYVEYITTAEEYTAQYYEGGSTIYGPGEAAMFGRTLSRLAASISGGDSLPAAAAPSLDLVVGRQRRVLPSKSSTRVPPPRIERVWCSGDTLYAWVQLGGAAEWPVSTGDVAAGPRVTIVVDDAARTVVSWDDDPALETRLRSRRGGLAWWELRWSGAGAGAAGLQYRGRIPAGSGRDPVRCPGA